MMFVTDERIEYIRSFNDSSHLYSISGKNCIILHSRARDLMDRYCGVSGWKCIPITANTKSKKDNGVGYLQFHANVIEERVRDTDGRWITPVESHYWIVSSNVTEGVQNDTPFMLKADAYIGNIAVYYLETSQFCRLSGNEFISAFGNTDSADAFSLAYDRCQRYNMVAGNSTAVRGLIGEVSRALFKQHDVYTENFAFTSDTQEDGTIERMNTVWGTGELPTTIAHFLSEFVLANGKSLTVDAFYNLIDAFDPQLLWAVTTGFIESRIKRLGVGGWVVSKDLLQSLLFYPNSFEWLEAISIFISQKCTEDIQFIDVNEGNLYFTVENITYSIDIDKYTSCIMELEMAIR